MVSSALDMELQELLQTLEELRRTFAHDAEYQELRQEIPPDWPM